MIRAILVLFALGICAAHAQEQSFDANKLALQINSAVVQLAQQADYWKERAAALERQNAALQKQISEKAAPKPEEGKGN